MRLIPNVWKCTLFLFVWMSTAALADEEFALPKAQMILEPNLVSIILNDEHRDGVDWEAIVSDFHSLDLKEGQESEDGKIQLSVGVVSDEDYEVLLDALDAVGQMTQMHQELVTLVEDTTIKIDFPNVDAKRNISIDAQFVKNSKGLEQLILSPEVYAKSGTTTVDVKVNAPIVLGSFFYEQEVTTTHKFPLLGDIPIIGLVFRNKGKLMQKHETIVFLTPKG